MANNNTAFELRDAQDALRTQMADAVRAYQDEHQKPLEISIFFTDGAVRDVFDPEEAQELGQRIRSLVDVYHHQAVVKETNVHVERVTLIDSDVDGEPAVNVKFHYNR